MIFTLREIKFDPHCQSELPWGWEILLGSPSTNRGSCHCQEAHRLKDLLSLGPNGLMWAFERSDQRHAPPGPSGSLQARAFERSVTRHAHTTDVLAVGLVDTKAVLPRTSTQPGGEQYWWVN